MARSVALVLREMQLIRSADVDGAVKETLLAPLKRELEFMASQMRLPLESGGEGGKTPSPLSAAVKPGR